MIDRERIVQLLEQKRPHLAVEFGVTKIGLFGSHADGQASGASDIDLVVEFGRPIGFRFFDLVEYLERLFGQTVDVLTPAGIQNIRIKRVAQDIAESIVYV